MAIIRKRLKQRERQLNQVSRHKRDFGDVSGFTRKTSPLYQPFNAG